MSTTTEIERKFLVARLPDLDSARAAVIRQGYLTSVGDSIEIRLRQKGKKHLITVKKGTGLERVETEVEIDRNQFHSLWPASMGKRLQKTRWTGDLACGAVFELDIYDDALAGLKVVEVEFPTQAAAESFDPPAWFGEEVTGNPSYSNAMLATQGRT